MAELREDFQLRFRLAETKDFALRQGGKRRQGRSIQKYVTELASAANAASVKKIRFMHQNLPGGRSAVVPPDPMPNSEVKRRSADGSVGSPHARVGNCQASNRTEGPVERPGLLFYLLSVGEGSPEQDKSAGSGFERCAATARRVAGRTPAINCQASDK